MGARNVAPPSFPWRQLDLEVRMKIRVCTAVLAAVMIPFVVSAKAAGPTIVLPDDTKWKAVSSGPMAGADMAVLMGDPSKAGPYSIRVKVKDGTKFGPHYHKEVENVTVVSGTLLVGLGDTMAAPDKMSALPAGAYASIPAMLHHYAMAKGETVIQIEAMGPRTMVMLKNKM